MGFAVMEKMAAQAIGMEVLQYLRQEEMLRKIRGETECAALAVLDEIRDILNNDTLDDPSCFRRIEAIVEAFNQANIDTGRHDW